MTCLVNDNSAPQWSPKRRLQEPNVTKRTVKSKNKDGQACQGQSPPHTYASVPEKDAEQKHTYPAIMTDGTVMATPYVL